MLSEEIVKIIGEEEYRRLSNKLQSIVEADYYYSKSRGDLKQFIAEITFLAYKKGVEDERYYSSGPNIISAYEE